MTAPTYGTDETRPEPVLDAARTAGLVGAFVVALLGLVAIVLAGQTSDLNALGYAISGVLTAGAALAAGLAPWWQALKARQKVTPLTDPRDVDGTPLVADLGDGATGTPYAGDDHATGIIAAQSPSTSLIAAQSYPGFVPQEDGVADHADDGPRSEAARQARLNQPDV